jgi:hypothetical protein
MSLLGRILPHYTSMIDPTAGNEIMSYEETVAELRERGLPPELIDHLRLAPEIRVNLGDGHHYFPLF